MPTPPTTTTISTGVSPWFSMRDFLRQAFPDRVHKLCVSPPSSALDPDQRDAGKRYLGRRFGASRFLALAPLEAGLDAADLARWLTALHADRDFVGAVLRCAAGPGDDSVADALENAAARGSMIWLELPDQAPLSRAQAAQLRARGLLLCRHLRISLVEQRDQSLAPRLKAVIEGEIDGVSFRPAFRDRKGDARTESESGNGNYGLRKGNGAGTAPLRDPSLRGSSASVRGSSPLGSGSGSGNGNGNGPAYDCLLPTCDAYVRTLAQVLEHLPQTTVVHRLCAEVFDAPSARLWPESKGELLVKLREEFQRRASWQGKRWSLYRHRALELGL